MKKTIAKTKLVLNHETVRSLDAHDLRLAAGGITTRGGGGPPCTAYPSGCMNVGVSAAGLDTCDSMAC